MIKIQSRQLGWSAKNYSAFWGRTYDEGLKWRLGTLQSPEKVLSGTSILVHRKPCLVAYHVFTLSRFNDHIHYRYIMFKKMFT